MVLPAPNLDDRRFQDLVDDAKRSVQQHCPEWTDHNVHDPGVTLIELFAWMTDIVLYRLNRVPERHYVKFLDLLGIQLFPPTAARAPVTFWLSAPQPETVRVPVGMEVATVRTETDDAIVFTTAAELPIVQCSLSAIGTSIDGADVIRTAELRDGGFLCFSALPKPGDAVLIGLSDPVPSCAVNVRLGCVIEGVGVDPTNPPLAWDAWTGEDWSPCEVDHDDTGGLNRSGDVVVHVPAKHVASIRASERAGWLRVRVVEAEAGQPAYGSSPRITAAEAFTVGGTVEAFHGETVNGEILGTASGIPGERFAMLHRPVVPSDRPLTLEVTDGDGWQEWTQVTSWSDSGPADAHFGVDATAGEVRLGPAVREADGSLRSYGAIPAKGSMLRMRAYRTGGGARGNVARGTLRVLKSSIPYVATVENRVAAAGGVDGEDIENAKTRGPIVLRTRGRAVTTEDYEQIAREAAPEVARVRCVPATDESSAGAVRVLIVPAVGDATGRLGFEKLLPADETLQVIRDRLESCRTIGARLIVEPPEYQGVTVAAKIKARRSSEHERLQHAALDALYAYFHPVSGGPAGTGWPFGRPVHIGEVYAVLQSLHGVELVEDARLFGADPVTGRRGDQLQRIQLDDNALVFSFGHQVLVEGV